VPFATAGSNVTLSLTSVDRTHLVIGNVLCPPTDLVPLVTAFTARVIVFDIQLPVTAGASVRRWSHVFSFLDRVA
jgi:elongation factor 1 alpha-like protein